MVLFFINTVWVNLILRFLSIRMLHSFNVFKKHVLIIGAGSTGFALYKAIKSEPYLGYIVVGFPETGYAVEYQYDRSSNTYLRFNGGRPHTDVNTEKQLAPTNIVVVRAAHSLIPGGSGVLDINMTGSGEATVFRDGQVVEGTWERVDVTDPLVLRDAGGGEIELTPGQTWLEIVEPTTPLHIQQ